KSRVSELLAPSVRRLVLQGSKDSFGTPEEIRTAIGNAPDVSVVELPGADHAYRIGKASPFRPADLRTTVVAEVSGFIEAVAGISTS
ncbi:MAG TPA: alpha/beta family hydrolase, partial [Propionibacteriaceae bacterium]|nr:alpha/beta family hydrolase [Propionibacteriaceae bacterium]